MQQFLVWITPNSRATSADRSFILIAWIVGAFLLWEFADIPFLPKPGEVLDAFGTLRQNGTFLEFGTSIWTMAEALFWTCLISLGLAYASVLPAIRPLVTFVAGLRYLGLVGLMLVFTLLAPNGHDLKVAVLTFGITVFYLRDMVAVVNGIPQERYDHAKTLGMGPIQMVFEVVVMGTLADALESLRVNAAMGWMMLTMVEGVVRSEGGIGVVLLNMNRHMDLAAEAAILIALFCVGLTQDFLIGVARDEVFCRYAKVQR